jgi:TPR repeat protein
MRTATVVHVAAALTLSACVAGEMPGASAPPSSEPPHPASVEPPKGEADLAKQKDYAKRLDAAEAEADKALKAAGSDASPELITTVERITKLVAEGRGRLSGSITNKPNGKKRDLNGIVWTAEDLARSATTMSNGIVASKAKKAPQSTPATTYESAKASCKADLTACQKACAADAAADLCVALAMATAAGTVGGPADFVRAHALVKKGCELGNKIACTAVKTMNKQADTCDDSEVCSHFCDAGLGGGCMNAGELLRDAKKKDLAKAAAFFKRGCDLGDPASCNALGAAYLLGEGVARDTKLAESLFTKACDGFQAKVNANPKEEDLWLARRDTACQNAYGTACVNKVQVPSKRRVDVDPICKKKALPPVAWSTSDGTDADGACMNAMMNRGCQQVMGTKAYCCPAQ